MRLIRCDSFLGLSGIVCRLVGKVRGDASTRVQRAAGLMGLMLLAVLVPTLLSCFTGAEREKLHAGRDARQTRRIRGPLPRKNVSRMYPPAKANPQRRTRGSGGTTWPSATPWLQGLARAGATCRATQSTFRATLAPASELSTLG